MIHNNENMTIFHVCLLPRSITRCDYMFNLSLFYQNKVQFDWFTKNINWLNAPKDSLDIPTLKQHSSYFSFS